MEKAGQIYKKITGLFFEVLKVENEKVYFCCKVNVNDKPDMLNENHFVHFNYFETSSDYELIKDLKFIPDVYVSKLSMIE